MSEQQSDHSVEPCIKAPEAQQKEAPGAIAADAHPLAQPEHQPCPRSGMARRAFLLLAMKNAAGLAALAAWPSTSIALANTIPILPGLAETQKRDPALVYAYREWKRGGTMNQGYFTWDRKTLAINALNVNGGESQMFVKNETPYTEPAFYYLVNLFEMSGEIINWDELKKKNLPLYYFAEGIGNYFTVWIRKNYYNPYLSKEDRKIKAEKYLSKAFVTACGFPESDSVKLINRIENMNEDQFIKDLRNKLSQQTHKNKLTAAWSSTFLTNIYRRKYGGEPMDETRTGMIITKGGFIMDNLERPACKRLGAWMRGPPGEIEG